MMPSSPPHLGRAAFTLVELLTVIAIISVLTGLTLVVLRQARGTAELARCGANLRQMGVACHLYVAEHRGRWPQAIAADELGTVRDYSWTVPLYPYLVNMGAKVSSRNLGELNCPPTTRIYYPNSEAQGKPNITYIYTTQNRTSGRQQNPKGGWLIYGDQNGAYHDNDPKEAALKDTRLLVNMSPLSVLLFEPKINEGNGLPLTETATIPTRLENADWERHNGKMNFLFVDGHIRTVKKTVRLNGDWEITGY